MNAVASRNIKFISHSDQGGRGDGVQVMVQSRLRLYRPRLFQRHHRYRRARSKHPKTVNFLACPPNTRAHHIQTHGDLLLAVNGPSIWTMQVSEKAYFSGIVGRRAQGPGFTTGLRVYDLSKPEAPREIAFMPIDGMGPHRIWYVGGATPISRFICRNSPTTCWPSSTWRSRRSRKWSANTGCRACGPAAARRRPGRRAGATRCITRWSPATSPTAPGATAALPCSMSAIRPAETPLPPQLGSAVRRRHPFAAAAAGPQSAGRGRRGELRQLQPRPALHLDVRCARAVQSGEHRDHADPGRVRLLRQGRQFRSA